MPTLLWTGLKWKEPPVDAAARRLYETNTKERIHLLAQVIHDHTEAGIDSTVQWWEICMWKTALMLSKPPDLQEQQLVRLRQKYSNEITANIGKLERLTARSQELDQAHADRRHHQGPAEGRP